MKIKQVTMYKYNKKLYETKEEAIEENENDIDKIINVYVCRNNKTIENSSKISLLFMECLIENREKLKNLLDLEIDIGGMD
jgi:hypothetical protein